MFRKTTLLALTIASITACQQEAPVNQTSTEPASATASNTVESESQKANRLYDEIFDAVVDRDPMWQTYLGIKKDYDKWSDISEENQQQEIEFAKQDLLKLQALDTSKLDPQTLLSYQLLTYNLENQIADYKWRHHNYPVNQMFGIHSQIPAFLINQHNITDLSDAEAYIARVKASDKFIAQLIEQLKIRADKNIIAPKFVFPHVLRDSTNIITGAPFEEGDDSAIYADFKGKVAELEIEEEKRQSLIKELDNALNSNLKPAYQSLIAYLTELEKKADERDGVWKFPDGEAYYNNALARTTTTKLTADEIHQIGLSEVERIHNEMRAIKDKVGFKGDLRAFMDFMRNDEQFYYPDTDEGREKYLSEAVALIDDMKTRLDELFITKPKAELKVKRVEAFREKSAGKAFYQMPAPDGSRPGIYYANLYSMKDMPIYQMAALAYHEGLPGHHMQIAIKQEVESLPKFRKFDGYTAYSEGWGLYSEMLPKEMGLYQDPYSDFGRLAMELWRACRLVVDTGIHAKQWTRQQGIDYYANNTPNAVNDAVKMVERHIVYASQATAYKIGMLKIIELREKARAELGEKFDIREYHDTVLRGGSVPMDVLEDIVEQYISDTKAKV